MLRYLWKLFTTPSAYLHNWQGYMVNQAGHGAIGLVLAHVIGWWALTAYAIWEVAQMAYADGAASDALEDWLFVAMGVTAVTSGAWWFIAFQAGWILHGVLVRRDL